MQQFLSKEYEEYFDEDWDRIEKDMLDGIEQMRQSKSFIKDIKIANQFNHDKENFNEKLKLNVIISDGKNDHSFGYYLHVRAINNLKQEQLLDSQFINKCFFISEYSTEIIKSLLNEIIKECEFNTGFEDIKEKLKEFLFMNFL